MQPKKDKRVFILPQMSHIENGILIFSELFYGFSPNCDFSNWEGEFLTTKLIKDESEKGSDKKIK